MTVPGVFDRETVMQAVREHNVHFIRFWFTDVLGNLKAFELPADQLEASFEEGMGFDGSSIEGFARLSESDMLAYPDPTTFTILPQSSTNCRKVIAGMFCNIVRPDGQPFEGDPRYALKCQLERLRNMGYTMNVGPELEYFLFKAANDPTPVDNGGYYDMQPFDDVSNIRRETVLALQDAGMVVEYSHHECAPGQQEIDLRYDDALKIADQVMLTRFMVKETAQQHGVYASFMPKPITSIPGSGMHLHQSIFTLDGKNAFYDESNPDQYFLSDFAKHYIAGLLKYAPEFCAVTNQYVNSYKRLVTGFEAPVYVTWGRRNRSALIRIPLYKPGKEKATRFEIRNPDPACNPYLVFAVILGAGIRGIEEKLELGPEEREDVFAMSQEERQRRNIASLPKDLGAAIDLFERSELMTEILGENVKQYFVRNKRAEWDTYRAHVTQWEMERYLALL